MHLSSDVYFSGMDKGLPSAKAFQPPPSILSIHGGIGEFHGHQRDIHAANTACIDKNEWWHAWCRVGRE